MSRDHRAKWQGKVVQDARKYWRALLPLPCYRCGLPVTTDMRWHVDHLRDLVSGGDLLDRQNQWPSHGPCNERAGQATAQERTRARKNGEQKIRDWLK